MGCSLYILYKESGIRNQESGVRSQESGVRNQESGIRSQADQITNHKSQITISAKNGTNLESLKQMLIESLDIQKELRSGNETVITNVRHYNSLINILNAVERIKEAMIIRITGDFLAADIRVALEALSEITGEVTNDEILGNIFGKFCIGK